MASRLYRTTRPLYLQVTRALDRLGIATIGSPTTAALIALYVTGLILLDARPTQTRLARFLPGRCHDALNRLLRTSPLSTRSLMGLLAAWVARSGVPGYLCLDDVVVEKAFAKRLRWAGWTYSFAKKRKVYGMHVVVVLWCSTDGGLQDPGCVPAVAAQAVLRARRLPDQAAAGRAAADRAGCRPPAVHLPGHGHPLHRRLVTRLAGRLGICWVGTLPPKTTVIWRGRRQSAAELAERLRLAWRPRLGLRAAAVTVYAPKYGPLRLVVTRNRHGNLEPVVTSDLGADLNRVVERKHSRWSVETLFRDTKQYSGLGACQCYTDAAMVRHVGLVLLGFVVLQHLRTHPGESLAAVKERWQLTLTHQGQPPPAPLKACPAHLRPTA